MYFAAQGFDFPYENGRNLIFGVRANNSARK